ncbi:hypothetical protein DY000_02030087 [Brassica cretica]|uniref:Uncharacterized protein n=1 Tax=Brassica cretica TaxID=69181 RepID=A0ABQ7DGA2_BRACR|nr:hypothetical protein DY000_02030087 [Brassica cretica]
MASGAKIGRTKKRNGSTQEEEWVIKGIYLRINVVQETGWKGKGTLLGDSMERIKLLLAFQDGMKSGRDPELLVSNHTGSKAQELTGQSLGLYINRANSKRCPEEFNQASEVF